MKVINVVGARPNFAKMAPLYFKLRKLKKVRPIILHTGQHYDYRMSRVFFEDFDLPYPHYFLGAGSGTHAEQTGRIIVGFEKVLLKEKPDLVIVFGDVNSTLACGLAAKKLSIALAHVEAGLRSFNMAMPEEVNRKVVDLFSDFLFTPSEDSKTNLLKEGIRKEKIHFVGNIMIDSLVMVLKKMNKSYENEILRRFGLKKSKYGLITLHRPANVDDKNSLKKNMRLLNKFAETLPLIFPMHPRTRKNIRRLNINFPFEEGVRIIRPVRYKEFIAFLKNSLFVLTDSGGIQEEATYLNIPCFTLRPETERPITINEGTNELVTIKDAEKKLELVLSGKWKRGGRPKFWDGRTAERIIKILENAFFK